MVNQNKSELQEIYELYNHNNILFFYSVNNKNQPLCKLSLLTVFWLILSLIRNLHPFYITSGLDLIFIVNVVNKTEMI